MKIVWWGGFRDRVSLYCPSLLQRIQPRVSGRGVAETEEMLDREKLSQKTQDRFGGLTLDSRAFISEPTYIQKQNKAQHSQYLSTGPFLSLSMRLLLSECALNFWHQQCLVH